MQIANAIYVNEKYAIRSSFKKLATQKFYSQVVNVDFSKKVAAAQIINGWVAETTNGLITDLVAAKTLKKDTGMILVNAMYFQAYWKNKFSASKTVNASTFYTGSSTTTTIDMMYQEVPTYLKTF